MPTRNLIRLIPAVCVLVALAPLVPAQTVNISVDLADGSIEVGIHRQVDEVPCLD